MLGYSDSNKDGGYLDVELGALQRRARLVERVRRARRAAAPVPRPRRHGRPRRRPELRGDPRAAAGSVDGGLRVTEQGEIIASKYSDPELGRRNLETLVAATLEASLAATPSSSSDAPTLSRRSWSALARMRSPRIARSCTRRRASSTISARRRRSPRSRELNIGSRPASRNAVADASRTCARFRGCSAGASAALMLPGLVRLRRRRSKLARASEPRRRWRSCATMHARWPFFRAMLSNMAMVLAKTDLAIASRYAELVPDAALRDAIFGASTTSAQRTRGRCFAITGAERAARRQPDARAQHPQPLPVPRPAQPPPDRAPAPLPRRRPTRARGARST